MNALPDDIQRIANLQKLSVVPDLPIYTADELGTAYRIFSEHKNSLRWCQEWQRWLIFDDQPGIWKIDNKELARYKALVSCIAQEQTHQNSKVKFTSVAHTTNSLTLAKSMLAVTTDMFDREPWVLNTPDGVYDLRSGEYIFACQDMFTMQTRVSPDPFWDPTETPYWVQHLIRMTKGNVEIMEFLRRLVGISLIGDQNAKPHLSPQLNGLGRNGKGVFCQGILYGLGDYGFTASSRLLTAKENAHTTEQASLRGKRMVVIEEVKRINSSLLKDLTGGGMKTARKMRTDDTQFLKSWTLWFNNNGPMMFSGDMSDGLWQRVPRIDFGVGIPEHERIDDYAIKLQNEASGILAWAIQGCMEFQMYNCVIPQSVKDATAERKADADPLKAFLNELYERNSTESVLGSAFVKSYTTWCRDRGENPGGMRSIYDELRNRIGLEVKTGSKNKTKIYGIKAKPLSLSEMQQSWDNN